MVSNRTKNWSNFTNSLGIFYCLRWNKFSESLKLSSVTKSFVSLGKYLWLSRMNIKGSIDGTKRKIYSSFNSFSIYLLRTWEISDVSFIWDVNFLRLYCFYGYWSRWFIFSYLLVLFGVIIFINLYIFLIKNSKRGDLLN